MVRDVLLHITEMLTPPTDTDEEDPFVTGDEGDDDLDDAAPLEFVIAATDDDDDDVRWVWDGSDWRRRF